MKKSKLAFLALFVFVLNLIWEFSHAILYTSPMLDSNYYLTLIRSSIYDFLWISLFFIVLSLIHKGITWLNKPKMLDYLVIIFLGSLISIISETHALKVGKWAYTSLMPTIFGIGLSPLIQLFTTAILSLLLFRYIIKKK